ncbi:Spermidine/putrescine ABC transporter, ATP-binding protein [Haemophilus influenzae]|uniref:Spermidine/putrescine ABC transporter, ATP-binding protein n=1 Tax=Haemophilus influenzae TaxID=727 RepID=A0A2X1PL76_HAEIF|nr:Spermidine/putrescine ABC transporter, ATP-binding protein [Haemophilus influenzae]
MTIFENVAFGLRMQKVPNEEIKPRVLEGLAYGTTRRNG